MAKPRATRAEVRRARRSSRPPAETGVSGWLRASRVGVTVAVVAVVAAVAVVLTLALSGDDSETSELDLTELIQSSDERLRSATPEELASESRLPISEVNALLEISDVHHWMGINQSWANNLEEVRHHIDHDIEVLDFDPKHQEEMELLRRAYDTAESREASSIRSTFDQGGQARDMDSVYLYGLLVDLAKELGRDDWTAHYQEHLDDTLAEGQAEQQQ